MKFAIGPAIAEGFYYDFDTEHRFTPEDLEKIEDEMKKLVKENFVFPEYRIEKENNKIRNKNNFFNFFPFINQLNTIL